DDGLRTTNNSEKHLNRRLGIAQDFFWCKTGNALRPVQVCARAEGFSISLKDDGSDFLSRSQLLECLCQILDKFFVECVVDFRPVQSDACYSVLNVGLKHSNARCRGYK